MPQFHSSPSPVIIRVEEGRPPSGKNHSPPGRHPLAPTYSDAGDMAVRGQTLKVNGWVEDRLSVSAPHSAVLNRPSSGRPVAHLNSRPPSGRSGARLERPSSSRSGARPDSQSSSFRSGPRFDNRSSASRPSSSVSNRPSSSRSGTHLGSRPSSSRPSSCLNGRPASSKSSSYLDSRPSSSRSSSHLDSRVSCRSQSTVDGRLSPSRPHSPADTSTSSKRARRVPKPPSASKHRASSWSGLGQKENHLFPPRSPSPDLSRSSSPGPGNENSLQVNEEGRPRSSQSRTGRLGGAGRAKGSRKERPSTAPIFGGPRYRDNIEREEEYQRERESSGGRKMVYGAQYSDDMKKKHEEIIRKILDEFDLEETKNKYRNTSVCETRRDGKSLADFRFRSELLRMMGSEVIRLSDQNWSQKFQHRLREDYERQLDEQEHNLEQAERQRIHRLRIEGVVHESLNNSKRAKNGSRRRGSKTSSSSSSKNSQGGSAIYQGSQRSSSSDLTIYAKESRPIFANEESSRRERILARERQDKIYRPSKEVQSQVARLNMREEEESKGNEEGEIGEEKTPEQMGEDERGIYSSTSVRHVTFNEGDMFALPDGEQRIQGWGEDKERAERRKKRYKHLPKPVAKLYEEETVTGLYSLAAGLVCLPTNDQGPKARVKAVTLSSD